MAALNTIRVPVASEYVFSSGFMVASIQAAMDFELRGKVDDWQARDKETGLRLWMVTGIDMDLMYQPEAEPARFPQSAEWKVRLLSATRPAPPPAQVPGFGPLVEFEGMTLTPYADSKRCKPPENGKPHNCGARMAFSVRATGMRAFSGLVSTQS